LTQVLNPYSARQFTDANGNPRSGYRLFVYAAGTTTKVTTTMDLAGTSNHANPIVLSTAGLISNGSAAQAMWQPAGIAVKLLLAPPGVDDPPSSTTESFDNISGINDTSITLSEWIAGPAPTFVSSTSFTLAGDKTTDFHIGRRVKTQNSGGTFYGTITNSVFTTSTLVTVVLDSGALDSGLSNVWFGIVGQNNSSLDMDRASICQGRLTLTTLVPVTTADVLAATTLFFTYKGNRIGLYDGSNWILRTFSELSLAVPATTSQMYDLFAFNNAGVVAIEALAWTNDTTRATVLVLQDGILVKSGATTRRYLGSFRTTTVSGQTEDSLAKRYVWNYYNRVRRVLKAATETTDSWTYTTAAFRQANANAANQLDFIIGVAEDLIEAKVGANSVNTTGNANQVVSIGLDSTTTADPGVINSSQSTNSGTAQNQSISAFYKGNPSIGRHFLAWLEYSTALGATTWFGDNGLPGIWKNGINGELLG
jgi:hypothetical protein